MGRAWSSRGRQGMGGAIGRTVLDLTRRAWFAYWTRRAAHATAAVLHSLDDRVLKDIGLDRSQIESVVFCSGCAKRGPSSPKAASTCATD